MFANLAGVSSSAGSAVQVPLPALQHRGAHHAGAGTAGQVLQEVLVLDEAIRGGHCTCTCRTMDIRRLLTRETASEQLLVKLKVEC